MKYKKHLVLFLAIFGSVLGGYFVSYANFSQQTDVAGKNEVYAREQGTELIQDNPNFVQLQNVFRAVPAKVLPSVVQINVSAVKEVPSINNPFFEFFGRPEGNEDNSQPKRQYRQQGLGSGSIIKREDETYYVLTNNHVIKDAEDIHVLIHDEQKFPAEVVGSDARVDLALLKFAVSKGTKALRVAELGDSSALQIGDWVMAIGSPDGFQSTVTQGIVSYIGRRGGPGQNINDFIQTDASINRGNSGGPLVNMNGQIVGINTWIASESGSSAGLGFSIPIDNAKFVIESFLQDGKLHYGWLGVSVPSYRKLLSQLSVEKEVLTPMKIYGKGGSFITSVERNSPAGKAGVLPGDFIVSLDGQAIESSQQLTFAVGMVRPKQKVRLGLIRNGAQQELAVTLGERKSEEELSKDRTQYWPGLMLLPLSKTVAEKLKLFGSQSLETEEKSGLLIFDVAKGSAAQIIGLEAGDVITQINGNTVGDLAQFYGQLNKSQASSTIFTYKRKGYKLETSKIKLR